MAGAQDLRSRYCFPSSPRGPGSPLAGHSAGHVAETWDAPPSLPPWSSPRHLASLLGTPARAHFIPKLILTGGTPTPSSHVLGTRPSETQAAETHEWPRPKYSPAAHLPCLGPNKSPAFNYASGLILMQLPGAAGGYGIGGGGAVGVFFFVFFFFFFFKPREVGLGGAGGEEVERW